MFGAGPNPYIFGVTLDNHLNKHKKYYQKYFKHLNVILTLTKYNIVDTKED